MASFDDDRSPASGLPVPPPDRSHERVNKFTIDLPKGTTIGNLTTAAGAIWAASAEFIDWEALDKGDPGAISRPGLILLDIARQLTSRQVGS